MLLAKACSDMKAIRDLAGAVSKQADSASLQMIVAQLPKGPASTFKHGQTMLHVLAESANEYLEVSCSWFSVAALHHAHSLA